MTPEVTMTAVAVAATARLRLEVSGTRESVHRHGCLWTDLFLLTDRIVGGDDIVPDLDTL